jgi:polyhydroxybutyrate depolymerase
VGSNAIIVYPNNATNYGSGNDIPFFDAMLADTTGKYCIDTRRVFATGFSMGGIFVNGIGCLRGGTMVRGIIPVAGSGPNPNMGPASEADIACPSGTPTADVAVMIIHGTADTNALFKYAQWEVNYWTKAEGCTSTTTTTNLSSPYQGCVTYPGCRVPVDFCQHTGGHMVPATAAANIWAFITNLP